jgi:hypothetical protein
MRSYTILKLFLLILFVAVSANHLKEPFVDSQENDGEENNNAAKDPLRLASEHTAAKDPLRSASEHTAAKDLGTNGFVSLKNYLSDTEVSNIRRLLMETVEKSALEFGNIDVKNGERRDLNLPINSAARSVIHKIYTHLKTVFDEYDPNPVLIEHSCFLNFPGSHPQNWHRDVEAHDIANSGKLFTIGVALDDISNDMGALQILPKSHLNDEIADRLNQRDCNEEMTPFCGYFHEEIEHLNWTCKRGDLLVWDSSLLHRSGGNRSGRMRAIYYFSLLFKTQAIPEGSTHSLLNKYKKKPIYVNQILTPNKK